MNENRIMIVDDEVDILNLLEKALNIEGYYNITKVDNGLDAVSICKQIQPDVIILDIVLPGIDGYEVCKRIRQFSHCSSEQYKLNEKKRKLCVVLFHTYRIKNILE